MEPLTRVLENPRGDRVRVTWLPFEVTGYDVQLEKKGVRHWAWPTPKDPPVGWVPSRIPGEYILMPSRRRFSEDRTVLVEGKEVGDLSELEPGCYVLEHLPGQNSF